tara:strand:+ start:437 stop:595 length:159 start_codon:yes stop_codon:yes gene_type:complete
MKLDKYLIELALETLLEQVVDAGDTENELRVLRELMKIKNRDELKLEMGKIK